MVTDVLINYLDDDKISLDKKRKFVEMCNLELSDLCNLMELYTGNTAIYTIVRSELGLRYDVNKFDIQMKKYRRKKKQAELGKRQKVLVKKMRGGNYDKHKRR